MGNGRLRFALWALVLAVLIGSLFVLPGARADPSTYKIVGSVEQPGVIPVPAGVAVDLTSRASGQVYTTTTTGSGLFTFDQSVTGGALAPGFWGLSVPPQANLSTTNCQPCAILPLDQNPVWFFENASTLSGTVGLPIVLSNVSALPYDSRVFGNVTSSATGKPIGSAAVSLLAPTFDGFVLSNATTNATGAFKLPSPSTTRAPTGAWVLQTKVPGIPNTFNYSSITGLSQSRVNLNVVVGSYFTYGWVNIGPHTPARVPSGGNVTVYDPTNGYIYSQATPPGGFYSIGTYPAGFTSHAAQTFDVILSNVGYGTTWFPLTVSFANPNGTPLPTTSYVPAIAPPAVYKTTLNFTRGFTNLSVVTHATLSNYSVFPQLPNASVGQLWAQLGLAFQHSLSFSAAGLPAVTTWANSSGPFLPAGQALVKVATSTPVPQNATFNETKGARFTSYSPCVGSCGLSSAAGLDLNWTQSYAGFPSSLPTGQRTYTISFVFRHPTNAQAFNYTVQLPNGYVLQAGTPPPAQTQIVPAGTGGTFTNFTLVSLPSSSAFGTATFNVVRYAGVNAIVNATVSNFAFSKKNVVNSTRGNYQVIVGTGQNVTFSGLNSSAAAGTNVTFYQWTFGDGSPVVNRTVPTTWHTYATTGAFHGSLLVRSSGGQTNKTTFTVYSGNTPPTAAITSSASAAQRNMAGSVVYLEVNQSTTLRFNATNSTSVIYAGAPVPGVISVASFNMSTAKNTWLYNFSAVAAACAFASFSFAFLGSGYYLTNGLVGSSSIPFKGWQYNLTLTVWDGGGHGARTTLVILVKDTEDPVPVVNISNAAGVPIPSSGVTEGANGTALVRFNSTGSHDPHNGSIVSYAWLLTNPANGSVYTWTNGTTAFQRWLPPQVRPYNMNLTVTDRAGNMKNAAVNFTVAINQSTRPVLAVGNLTSPATMVDGTTYTIWANVTNTIGKNSTAQGVTVTFYLLPPSGAGSRILIGGSPASVRFFNYSHGVPNTVPFATGSPSIAFNHTYRAQITFNPGRTGTYNLWVNATASNEFSGSYGPNQANVPVQLNPNPTVAYYEYGAIAAAAAAVIVVLFLFYRRGRMKASPGKPGQKPARKESRPSDDEEDET